jgi:hypothetical protein
VSGPVWARSRARPRRRLRWWIAGLAAAVIAFTLGVALGQALEERPDPERAPPTTLVRTFTVPLTAPPQTVTVTEPEGG